jgi:hypothetical protein
VVEEGHGLGGDHLVLGDGEQGGLVERQAPLDGAEQEELCR